MIDYTLRECPFCGNPAEIVEGKPYEWFPTKPVNVIRCSNEWCRLHNIDTFSYQVDLQSPEVMAREDWNRRKRKNKLTWREADNGK